MFSQDYPRARQAPAQLTGIPSPFGGCQQKQTWVGLRSAPVCVAFPLVGKSNPCHIGFEWPGEQPVLESSCLLAWLPKLEESSSTLMVPLTSSGFRSAPPHSASLQYPLWLANTAVHHQLAQDPPQPKPLFSLQYIPMPVLYGVFLYMGVASLNGIQVRSSPGQCDLESEVPVV